MKYSANGTGFTVFTFIKYSIARLFSDKLTTQDSSQLLTFQFHFKTRAFKPTRRPVVTMRFNEKQTAQKFMPTINAIS